MALWKTPPKAKLYEALTAVADGRVRLLDAHSAEVRSSDGSKAYTVEWTDDLAGITSNDNASYWQGYLGYPILAALMALGRLPYDPTVAGWLAGIEWKALNARFRNDYDRAVEFALAGLEDAAARRPAIAAEVDRLYRAVSALKLAKLPRRRPPPK